MSNKSDIRRIQTKADLCPEDFEYHYNPQLTSQLDVITSDFDQNIINAIALWKVNRYPYVDETITKRLNGIVKDQEYNEGHKEILRCFSAAEVFNFLWRQHSCGSETQRFSKSSTNESTVY
jgi:hypothetical protein